MSFTHPHNQSNSVSSSEVKGKLRLSYFLARRIYRDTDGGKQVSRPAVVIAMMGVFGLVTLSTRQRTKEIGIRKVNGAHSGGIVKMFCLEYLKWVGIAFVPACPLGYLFMYHWLDEFAYRTTMSWWLFLGGGLIIAGITLLTVIGQTWRTASQNPVRSLRYE